MKLSVSWLSDHLKASEPLRIVSTEWAQQIVDVLGRSVTEIDAIERVVIDLDAFVLAQCISVHGDYTVLRDAETGNDYGMPSRPQDMKGQWYVLKKPADDSYIEYATYVDLGGTREGFVPAVAVSAQEARGDWKRHCDMVDYRIIIDNKAITHRPDLWSHRGFAREIGALLKREMVPLDNFLAKVPHVEVAQGAKKIIQTKTCDYFGHVAIPSMTERMSPPWLAFRLIRLDQRPINLLVDATNYVMLDIGQPLHVFDASKVHEHSLIVRQAHPGESLTLLDDKVVQLDAQDCVIADNTKALSLAGIMGGKESAYSADTQSVIVESAHFDPIAVRASATRHRIRTEASSRFEKDLDAHVVVSALQRYIHLLVTAGVTVPQDIHIATEGMLPLTRTITIEHDYLEKKLGVSVQRAAVCSILDRLGILCRYEEVDAAYKVHIPSWRMRDLKVREDIVEEIARSIGYDAIKPSLPPRLSKPASYKRSQLVRLIKHHLAFGWRMQEVHNYVFYDEQFLQQSKIDINDAINIKNPVSEQWQRLVSSLIPHLLKNVSQNIPEHNELAFFEMNETWSYEQDRKGVQQRRDHGPTLGFMWYTRHKKVDFYQGAQIITSLSELIRLPLTVEHVPSDEHKRSMPWYDSVRRASIRCSSDTIIGWCGMLDQRILGTWCEGTAFCGEIMLASLLSRTPTVPHYQAVSKFPVVMQDISVMVSYPQQAWGSVVGILRDIRSIDSRITDVDLIDFFEKDSFKDQRSLTFRLTISDTTKTLTRDEIDGIMQIVKDYFAGQGAVIR